MGTPDPGVAKDLARLRVAFAVLSVVLLGVLALALIALA